MQMMFRKLILSLVLLTNAFAQSARLSSSSFHGLAPARTSAALAQAAASKASGFDAAYRLSLPKPVQDKNFYLLSLFQRSAAVRTLIGRNKTLSELTKDKTRALKKASSC